MSTWNTKDSVVKAEAMARTRKEVARCLGSASPYYHILAQNFKESKAPQFKCRLVTKVRTEHISFNSLLVGL